MKAIIPILLAGLLLLTGCGEKAAETIDGQHYCNLTQGFNFVPSRQNPVGYITYLKIGDYEGAADIEVIDPEHGYAKMQVFGVVSWLTWKEKADEPIVFAAQVSGANKDMLIKLGESDLTGIEIEFAFDLYEYDQNANKYYKSMSSGAAVLEGTFFKNGEYLLFLISGDAGVDVPDPENFNFQLGVKAAGPQQIEMAEKAGKGSAVEWGE